MKFNVDVKAFINITVEAPNEDAARKAADEFVEQGLYASEQQVRGYNEGNASPDISIVPAEYSPSVDGESDVEEADDE